MEEPKNTIRENKQGRMKIKKTYKIIGLMSGTSLDGLDIAYCTFSYTRNRWHYKVAAAETIPYSHQWKNKLQNLETKSALEFALTDTQYGHLIGKETRDFIKKYKITPDFIASHGHTIFHQPGKGQKTQGGKGMTTQIGNGAAIAAESGFPVICDFRTGDVARGGQGAPLVPIGDSLLFADYKSCINLGGFANISYNKKGLRQAYDICPVNIVLNDLSQKLGRTYDTKGSLARIGLVNDKLLAQLNGLPYYKQKPPKSLGKEWVKKAILPLLKNSKSNPHDLLRTFTEHAAIQISKALQSTTTSFLQAHSSSLFSGGGTYNSFLVERIRFHSPVSIFTPDRKTIEFKEALIFSFLGLLRWTNQINCLSSVTGAKADSAGGCIYL